MASKTMASGIASSSRATVRAVGAGAKSTLRLANLRHNNVAPAARASRRSLHSTSTARDMVMGAQTSPIQLVQDPEDRASFSDPVTRYEHLVSKGILKADDHQRSIIQHLQRLHRELVNYDPGPVPGAAPNEKPSFFGSFFSRKSTVPEPIVQIDSVPKGLYLHGSVGTGKTMLMDLFHSTLPPQFRGRGRGGNQYGSTRIHFHSFMLDVLRQQHDVKSRYDAVGLLQDATPEVARSLASEGRILCFDEFQVTDIVTAMILRQLLERLMGFGVVCIMTSNRHPDELYMNGIQRQSFLPAIELIKHRFKVVDLNSETDYRKIPRALSKVYFNPLTPETSSEMSKLFDALTSADPVSPTVVSDRKMSIWGRSLAIPESSGTVARFSFSDLCNKPLSAADYLELTATFPTIFVQDVPRMGLGERDQARRFITFIDACYENRTKLFVSSEVPINQVFSDEKGKNAGADDAHMRAIMDDLGLTAESVGVSSLFSGDEEMFAFARCVSRLSQMGTKEWAEATNNTVAEVDE